MPCKLEIDRNNVLKGITSHKNVNVKIEKFTKNPENQQSVTIIFSGEETHKIQIMAFEILRRIKILKSIWKNSQKHLKINRA